MTPPTVPVVNQEGESIDPYIKRAFDNSQSAYLESLDSIKKAQNNIDEKISNLITEIKQFNKSFDPIKTKYNELVKVAGGNQIELSEKRKLVNNQISELDKETVRLKGNSTKLNAITDKRKKILSNLDKIRKEYFEERKKRCEFFTSKSNGVLNVSLQESGDTSDFEKNLLQFKRGSWLRDEDVRKITSKVSPYDFIRCILSYEWYDRKKDDAIKSIQKKTDLEIDKIKKLFDHFLDEFTYEEILALQYKSMPNDKPLIQYRVGNDYKPLSELSVGQKSVALLIMALSDGSFPIVIDQPEDSLDLRSIWDDVCSKVRDTKEFRQFIFTTHNSSVAVGSDSDNFSILESDANSGKVILTGSINKEEMRKQVIEFLEGAVS